ncbi:HNH endonuclease [Fibrobacter sp. UWB13]|nr:HNH endonuclease [Fibrobacter sp. UWB13]
MQDHASVRNELQIFFSKELRIWENGLFVKLGLNPPYELAPPSSPDSHYPNPENTDNAKDGEVRDVLSHDYERDPKNRAACLKHFGYKCQICGFDFSTFYGPEFAGKIEVHHIDPLCRTKSAHAIDPIKDLIPVCPNCHTALHGKTGASDEVYMPDELRAMIKRAKKE